MSKHTPDAQLQAIAEAGRAAQRAGTVFLTEELRKAAAQARDLLAALESLLAEAEDVFNCMADATGIDRKNYPQPFIDARAVIKRAREG